MPAQFLLYFNCSSEASAICSKCLSPKQLSISINFLYLTWLLRWGQPLVSPLLMYGCVMNKRERALLSLQPITVIRNHCTICSIINHLHTQVANPQIASPACFNFFFSIATPKSSTITLRNFLLLSILSTPPYLRGFMAATMISLHEESFHTRR